MARKPDYSQAVRFLFEAGALKRLSRSGWRLAGIPFPESVAAHSHRAAVIAFMLARMEGANPYKTCSMAVFHDLPEARIGDLDRLQSRYIDKRPAERKAASEQAMQDDPSWYMGMLMELADGRSVEAVIVKDADLLECALSALEYVEDGFPKAKSWADSCAKELKTESARQLLAEASKKGATLWWKGLK